MCKLCGVGSKYNKNAQKGEIYESWEKTSWSSLARRPPQARPKQDEENELNA